MLRKYKNAFSLIAPAISDSKVFLEDDGRYKAWGPSSMTSRGACLPSCSDHHMLIPALELCSCIADGLMKLKAGGLWLYTPDLKWPELEPILASSPLYDHLISRDEETAATESSNEVDISQLRKTAIDFLDVKSENFSDETPLTAYGLDSLVAGKLVIAFKPFVQISQLELLADLTLNDIYGRIRREVASVPLLDHVNVRSGSESLIQPRETIVKLVEGEETPFILIHGSGGSVLPFLHLQKRFSLPLWVIQATPDVPLDTINNIARFYFARIKEHLPKGPYRLGSFSSSAFIATELVFLFESNGDDVVQFVNLDLPPTVFTPPMFTWDPETIETTQPSRKLMHEILDFISALTNADIRNCRLPDEISQEVGFLLSRLAHC